MNELTTPNNGNGMYLWVHARLPVLLPMDYRLLQRGADGAAYIRDDGLSIIVSGDVEADGKRWLHVSCARRDRLPSWEDLRQIKDTFIGRDTYAAQLLPPAAKYVNIHPYCLHLFACVDGWPLPDFTRGGRSL